MPKKVMAPAGCCWSEKSNTFHQMIQHIWMHLRAVLIAMHIFAVTALAVPAPQGGMDKRAWSNPTVQAEFSAWADRLTAIGRPTTTEALEESLWTFAVTYMKRRKSIIEPMMPYYNYCGTYQSWRMFIAPHRNPARLHIDVYKDGAWQPVYISRDREHNWNAAVLDNERFRAALFRYAWRRYNNPYRQFGRWTARQLFETHPSAETVRLQWYRFHTIAPHRIRAGEEQTGKFEKVITFTPEDVRSTP